MDINRAARQRGKYPPLSQLLRWIVLLIHLGTSLSARQSGSAKCITWFNWKVNINHHCTYIQLLLEIYLTTYKMRGSANIVLLSLKPVVHIFIRKLLEFLPTLDIKNRAHQGIQSQEEATNVLSICFTFISTCLLCRWQSVFDLVYSHFTL